MNSANEISVADSENIFFILSVYSVSGSGYHYYSCYFAIVYMMIRIRIPKSFKDFCIL